MAILLITFIALLVLGVPVAYCIFGSSVLYLVTHGIDPVIAAQRIMAGPNSFTLLAVPGFILAAAIMNTGGITERIFDFADKCVGHITGGLGHANIFASVLFAGMSGSAVADAGGLGAVELRAMRDAGYDDDFSLAVTGASSIIGPIIPPSIPAVIYAVSASVSVGKLFMAGFLPGIIMALCMSGLVYFQCRKKGYKSRPRATLRELWTSFRRGFFSLLLPAVLLIFITFGVTTPTEAAMAAVVYALILSACYKAVTPKKFIGFLRETLASTVPVMFINSSAMLFGWILASERVPQKVAELFLGLTDNKIILLLIINLLLLVVGCFMETTSSILILTPVLLPLIKELGVDPVHFGLVMILNLVIGLMTPPVGMVLYTLSAVSKVPFERITKAILPYVALCIVLVLIFTFVPQIALLIPNMMAG